MSSFELTVTQRVLEYTALEKILCGVLGTEQIYSFIMYVR